jgi:8-oxo-dGTP pyrophosphatase MutT (NUDIX family)
VPDASGRVLRIDRCDLRVAGERWAFADRYGAEIDAHWARRKADNPAFFNGTLHLMTRHDLAEGAFTAQLVRTDFKSFLYWRETGAPDRSVADAFGSALLRSVEGHVLLGRQRPGNINGGLAYLPGGFIDARDVVEDGAIDIEASIARELAEETGLEPAALERTPGFILTFLGPMVSIAAEFRSPLPAEELCAAISAHIAAEADPELAEMVVVRSARDLDGLDVAAYASVLLPALFEGR